MDTTRIVLRATAALYQRISAQIILLATFVAMVWFLVYFVLNSGFANRLVDGSVNTMFRGKIGWTRVTWGPMPWSLEVLEPVLVGASGQPIVTAAALHVEAVDLMGLLERRIAASGIRVERPVVRLTARRHPEAFDDLGQPRDLLDIVEMFWPPGPRYEDGMPGDPPHLEFADIDIVGGMFVLDMPSVGIEAGAIAVESGRFELQPTEGDSVMQIGAEKARFGRGELRIQRGEGPVAARARPTNEVFVFPVRDAEISQFRWFGDQFSVQKVKATHRGDTLLVNRFLMRLDTPDLPYMAARVHLKADEVADHLAQFGVRDVRGPALLTFDGRGEIDGFEGQVRLEGERLEVGPARLGRWAIEGHKDIDDRFDLTRLEVNIAGGLISGVGGADLVGGHAWADLWLRQLDPAALPLGLDGAVAEQVAELAGGRLDGPLAAHGWGLYADDRWVSAAAGLRLQRRGKPRYGLSRQVELKVGAGLRGADLRLFDSVVESGETRLEIERGGRLDLERLDARVDGALSVGALGPVMSGLGVPVVGAIDVPRFEVRGGLTDPRVKARINGTGVRYDTLPAADLGGSVAYRDGVLTLAAMKISPRGQAKGSGVTVNGTIGVRRSGTPLALTAEVKALRLGPLGLVEGLDGAVDATIGVTGPTDRLAITAEDGVVSKPRWNALAYDTLEVDGRFADGRLTLGTLALYRQPPAQEAGADEGTEGGAGAEGEAGASSRQPMLTASGLTLDRAGYDGTVQVDRFPLADLERLQALGPLPVSGAISARLSGEGTFAAPVGKGQITLHDIVYDGMPPLGSGTLQVRADGPTVKLDGRLFDRFAVLAKLPTQPGTPAWAKVRVNGLLLETYLEEHLPRGLTGRVSAEVEARMDLFEGALLGVTARVDALQVAYAYGDPHQGQNALETFELTAAPRADQSGRAAGEPPRVEPIKLSLVDEVVGIEKMELEVSRRPSTDPYAAPRPGKLRLSVTGSVDVGGAAPALAVNAQAQFGLALFQPFVQGVFTEVKGEGRLSTWIRGPVGNPQVEDGEVVITSASVVPRSAVVGSQIELVDPLALRIDAFPDAGPVGVCSNATGGAPAGPDPPGAFLATLARPGGRAQRVRLDRDESPVVLTDARVEFRRFRPDRMRFEADVVDQTINIPRTLRATVEVPNLAFELCRHLPENRPPEDRMIVGGDVQVTRGEYTADITSASDINQGLTDNLRGTAQARTVSVFERVPALKQLYLDLSLRGDGDFYIRNQVTVLTLDLEIRPTLRSIRGLLVELPDAPASDQLELEGRVDIVPGSELTYARRPFEVSAGSVSFGGGNFLDAQVEASHTFRIRTDDGTVASTAFDTGGGDVRLEEVTLRARYRLPTRASEAEINLDLISNSGASDLEIATLVLTGSLPDRLQGAAGAQPATEVLLGPLLGLIERPLEDTLDLDLSLTPATTGTLFIDADKLLSRRLRLYSRTLVGDEDGSIPQTFGLEYRINNAATAELSNQQAGTLNSTSGRLRLRFDLD